ncbi:hypothetical protein EVAR_51555_1 [Eumeta japonica]|uniref:Uncharacterized protein n=1 Tax=Eumeta variegata TaxID=151549 RepID=A0A4C1YH44_EUMVA|nr:hypothetical protein EVAR_51555_1 [Eumeta japonica]
MAIYSLCPPRRQIDVFGDVRLARKHNKLTLAFPERFSKHTSSRVGGSRGTDGVQIEGQGSMRATKADGHRHPWTLQTAKSHKCVAGLLSRIRVFDERKNLLMEKKKMMREEKYQSLYIDPNVPEALPPTPVASHPVCKISSKMEWEYWGVVGVPATDWRKVG